MAKKRRACPSKPQTELEERVQRIARRAAENFEMEENYGDTMKVLDTHRAETRFWNTSLSREHPETRDRFVREAVCWWRRLK